VKYVAFVSVLLFGAQAFAYTDLNIARRILNLTPYNVIHANQETRESVAKAIMEYWADVDNRLPRLSPSEREWLSRELGTTDIERIRRAARTPEFSLMQLENIVNRCIGAVKPLIPAQDEPTVNQLEMFFWTRVASCYHQSGDDISHHFRAAGLNQSSNEASGYTFDHMILGRILDVIIPSAMADLMGWALTQD